MSLSINCKILKLFPKWSRHRSYHTQMNQAVRPNLSFFHFYFPFYFSSSISTANGPINGTNPPFSTAVRQNFRANVHNFSCFWQFLKKILLVTCSLNLWEKSRTIETRFNWHGVRKYFQAMPIDKVAKWFFYWKGISCKVCQRLAKKDIVKAIRYLRSAPITQ